MDLLPDVLASASREATRLGHGFVGTEHLYLAVLELADEPLKRAFEGVGVSRASYTAVLASLMPSSPAVGRTGSRLLRLTPEAAQTVDEFRVKNGTNLAELAALLVRHRGCTGSGVLRATLTTHPQPESSVDERVDSLAAAIDLLM